MNYSDSPFPSLIIDNFLPKIFLEKLEQELIKPPNTSKMQMHPAGYTFEAFMDAELIRYLYRFIKRDLPQFISGNYTWSSIYKLPQIYKTLGPWSGLPPHTDNQPGRDLAMIIYLSSDWKEEYGGELQLFNYDNGTLNCEKTISPLFNRAVFFPLGKDSWHSVSPIYKDWKRMTLIQDWQSVA